LSYNTEMVFPDVNAVSVIAGFERRAAAHCTRSSYFLANTRRRDNTHA
jgi:hypothetical protein